MAADNQVRPQYCDLVMKGGVTSGIVYPLVVCELAKVYRFRNIGGTSAGAIAAAATAAAEYGRRTENGARSYARLSGLPDEVAGQRLLELFRPDPPTRAVFRFLLLVGRSKTMWGKITAAVATLTKTLGWLWIVLLAWIVGWTAVLLRVAGGAAATEVWILAAVWWLLGFCLVLIFQCFRLALRAAGLIPTNFYGLCTGCAKERKGEYPSLTVWLYRLFNDLAGLPEDRPLTFGDLWQAPAMPGDTPMDNPVINLEVITTDVSRGRPFRIPYGLGLLYFKEKEWTHLFPEPVLNWLKTHPDPKAPPVHPDPAVGDIDSLLPLPQPADLPVVVAARLSLSFPLLIRAIPLYAADETLRVNRTARERAEPQHAERVWFSDGGISSNFPIHFFDAPLPRWPTFGIDLAPPRPDGSLTPWMAGPDSRDWLEYWDRFGSGASPGRLGDFVRAILSTMQNWRDNLQVRVPGYWDRVVHIPLKPREGGLNLTMGPEAVNRLSDRGRSAGFTLVNTFLWTNHAWVRYRSTMGTLEAFLDLFQRAYLAPIPGDQEAWDLIQGRSTSPPSYPWLTPAQAAWAPSATHELVDLISRWTNSGAEFQAGAPTPDHELRVTPKV